MIKFNSIQTRLTFWFLAITLIPLLSVLVITYFQRVNVIETWTLDKLTAIRDLKVSRLDDWLLEREGDMRNLAGDMGLRKLESIAKNTELSTVDHVRLEAGRNILLRFFKRYQAYSELSLINPANGKILISTKQMREGEERSLEPYFKKPLATRKLVFTDIFYSRYLSENTMVYSIPVFSAGNEKIIVGILVAHIDLHSSLYKMLLDRVGLGKTGETLIVNKDVIALNQLRWHDNAPLRLQIHAQPAVRSARGETGIVFTTDYRNEPILAAFTHISKTGWGFVCKQDRFELNEPIREMVQNFIMIFVITGMIIIFLSIVISKSISKPILDMNEVARELKGGNLSVRNQVHSSDELGSLAVEFNNLADEIESKLNIQEGGAAISKTMIGKSSIEEFALGLLNQLLEICDAGMGCFYVLDNESFEYRHFVSIGANEAMMRSFKGEELEGQFGISIHRSDIFHLKDIPDDSIIKYNTIVGEFIPKEMISIPIVVDDEIEAIISIAGIKPFKNDVIEVLSLASAAINNSYTALLSSDRTQVLAENLARSNQQLQSQSEELKRNSEELRLQNVELEEQRKQTEVANRLKSDFLSNMSHELRTPLNSVMALSKVLMMQAEKKLNDEEYNYLHIIERNGRHLLELINGILDLSKIESGRMEVNPTIFSLTGAIEAICENLEPIAADKGIGLNLDIPPTLPKLESDEMRVHQIFQNIINNAVKFTTEGQVDITAEYTDESVTVRVKDSGIGIAKEDLPHIFEEFRQVDGSASRRFEGTGLGLAIAKKSAQLLGGDILVESRYHEGTLFSVILPIRFSADKSRSSTRPTVLTELEPPAQKTVLIVDDEPDARAIISDALIEAGYGTVQASNGTEALELAEIHSPFAITLDIIMPDMDGFEVLQNLKRNHKTKEIPVIIVSLSDQRETGFALGAVDYIMKPVSKHILINQVKRISELPIRRVLVVDDNEIDQSHTAHILEQEGIQAILASDGEQCLSLLDEQSPDLVLLDLMMPGLSGFEVLDRIRANPKWAILPVIIISAKDINEAERKRLEGQVSAVLSKSDTKPEQLMDKVRGVLSRLYQLDAVGDLSTRGNARILLVEDNQSAIVQIRTFLENEGFDVVVAKNGLEAIDSVRESIPDGIILDLMMPKMDGFEVLNTLRGAKETAQVPVLILTAKDLSPSEIRKIENNHVHQMIQKGNVERTELLSKVYSMLGSAVAPIPAKQDLVTEMTIVRSDGFDRREENGLKTILVIEDNPDNQTTIQAILKDEYHLSIVFDGETGLREAMTARPDLILLDISLPGMDGFEVVRRLKDNLATREIPVIALTARAMKGDRDAILEAGCDDYSSKPIDPGKFRGLLDKWLT